MLNYAETASVSTIVSSDQPEEQTTFISPMPKCVVLGHVTLANNHEEFLQAFDAGMECYCEIDYQQRHLTAQNLLSDLLETFYDHDTSPAWRVGFIAGQIAGLLNPDLAEADRFTCLESLTRKCEVMYPGPEQWSIYTRAIHKAACIDNVPIEGLPALESVTLPSRVQQDSNPITRNEGREAFPSLIPRGPLNEHESIQIPHLRKQAHHRKTTMGA